MFRIPSDIRFPKIIGFDTETQRVKSGRYSSQEFISGQFFSPQLNINTYTENISDIARMFSHKTQGAIFVANNAEFDFAVLTKILDHDYFKFKCLYNGSRFLYGKVIRGKHTWRIYDLMNIFVHWSLAKIGEFIGIPKLDKPSYLGVRKPETLDEQVYFEKYAMRDAEIGYWAAFWIASKFGSLSLTLPSLSFKYFNKQFKPKGLYLTVDESITEKIRLAYKGGRTECFIRGTPDKKEWTYDKVSLYPSVMRKYCFPMGIKGFKRKTTANFCHEGFAHVIVKQDAEIPFLGIKYWCDDGNIKLIFPNGKFDGWFTYPELRYFQNKRLGKILKVIEAYECEGTKPYFRGYIDEFFTLKNEDKDHASFWKLCMNSLYGKFAQDCHGAELIVNGLNQIEKDNNEGKKNRMTLTNPLIAAYITAYGRCEMYDEYLPLGAENLAYTDTDSIHTFKQVARSGTGLGDLKFELEGNGTYIRTKFYTFNNYVRCRGMERIFEVKHIKAMIERNDVTIMSQMLLRLRSAFRQHQRFLTEKPMIKHFSLASDCKRIYEKDLKGKELLDNWTYSKAVVLNGDS